MRRADLLAASDDLRDGVPYDPDYAEEWADVTATAYGRAQHLPLNAIRDLTNDWLEGYLEGYQDSHVSEEH
jgi:hypothetical protein